MGLKSTRSNLKETKFIILFILSLLCVAIFVSSHYFNSPDQSLPAGAKLKSSVSFASMEGLSLEEKSEDDTSFSIYAESANVRNRKIGFLRLAFQKVIEMEKVRVLISEPGDAAGNVEIVSDQATMHMNSKNILFKGNVVCSSDTGDVLKSDKLLWDRDSHILSTDNEYTFTGSDGAASRGKGFKSTSVLKAINFENKYKSILRGEQSDNG